MNEEEAVDFVATVYRSQYSCFILGVPFDNGPSPSEVDGVIHVPDLV